VRCRAANEKMVERIKGCWMASCGSMVVYTRHLDGSVVLLAVLVTK
jgi:hypothetical protein